MSVEWTHSIVCHRTGELGEGATKRVVQILVQLKKEEVTVTSTITTAEISSSPSNAEFTTYTTHLRLKEWLLTLVVKIIFRILYQVVLQTMKSPEPSSNLGTRPYQLF